MAWSIEFDPEARRELEKLDKPVSDRILKFLRERVAPLDDPRSIGGRLHAPLRQYWKHRIGDSCLVGSLKEARRSPGPSAGEIQTLKHVFRREFKGANPRPGITSRAPPPPLPLCSSRN